MRTPARRIATSIGAAAAVASGGFILFWLAGFLSFFVVEWFRAQWGSGGLGAVSVGVPGSAALLLIALPVCVLMNRRLRAWARTTPGRSYTLHRLHSLTLWLFFILLALAVALMLLAGNEVAVFAAAGILLPVMVLYGLQFLLLGALLGLYAAAPDPDATRSRLPKS